MRLVDIKDCKGGEVLAEAISFNDTVMLKKGATLTESLIKSLIRRDIKRIYVESYSITTNNSEPQTKNTQPVKKEKKGFFEGLWNRDSTPSTTKRTATSGEKPKKIVTTQRLPLVFELEVTIDFAIPAQVPSPERLKRALKEFLGNIDRIGIYPVAFVPETPINPTEIEELKHFSNFEDIKSNPVFQITEQKIYIQYYGDVSSIELENWFWYRYKKGVYCIQITSINKRRLTSSRPMFVGKSKPFTKK